jgi:hypothetical protein
MKRTRSELTATSYPNKKIKTSLLGYCQDIDLPKEIWTEIIKFFCKLSSSAQRRGWQLAMLSITSRQLKTLCDDFIRKGDNSKPKNDPFLWNWVVHAAQNNHTSLIKYAYENGFSWGTYGPNISYFLASNGNLECLKYVHERGCTWNEEISFVAAGKGRLDILMYAHEHGCNWNAETCSEAASKGHLACLKYMHENGCEWDAETCLWSAFCGHLDCLTYAHDHGCEFHEENCQHALEEGNLECFKYLDKNGADWGEEVYFLAVRHLHCVKYLHEELHVEWIEDYIDQAAIEGQLDVVKYMHEEGCPWDYRVCDSAIKRGYQHIVEYAHANGCPCQHTT